MFPIHVDLGFTPIYFYEGMYFLISIVFGVYLSYRRIKKHGGKVELFDSLVFWSIIGALFGARLSHYLFWNLDLFLENPLVLFSSGAGNSITGGLVGGMVGGYLFTRKKKINYFEYFSMISPALLVGVQ